MEIQLMTNSVSLKQDGGVFLCA